MIVSMPIAALGATSDAALARRAAATLGGLRAVEDDLRGLVKLAKHRRVAKVHAPLSDVRQVPVRRLLQPPALALRVLAQEDHRRGQDEVSGPEILDGSIHLPKHRLHRLQGILVEQVLLEGEQLIQAVGAPLLVVLAALLPEKGESG
jgi:hypothetical protein